MVEIITASDRVCQIVSQGFFTSNVDSQLSWTHILLEIAGAGKGQTLNRFDKQEIKPIFLAIGPKSRAAQK